MPLKKIREISDAGAPVSIRRILTGWLVWPLAALILASTIPTYFLALNAANDAYDSALLDLLRPAKPVGPEVNPAQRLVDASVLASGRDNTTALVIQIG